MPHPVRVFITGCSSGIGKRLIDLYDREEYQVFVTARGSSFERLKQITTNNSNRVIPFELDVTDLDQATQLIQSIESEYGPINILINNAGVSYRTVVEEMLPLDEQRQLATNFLGPMHLIRLVIPSMRKRKTGRIINISSVGGMMAMPTMSSYSASKFALEGASEALWYEVKPFNIKITLVRPGFINSSSFTRVKYGENSNPEKAESPYYHHYKDMTAFIAKLMRRTKCTPESVAKTIFKVSKMKSPPLRIAGTNDAWFFHFLRRLLPRSFYHWLLYRLLPNVRHWGQTKDGS